MMWAAIKVFASGAFERALKALSAIGGWLTADWRNGPLVFGWLGFAAYALLILPARDAAIVELETDLTAEQEAHLGTVNAFLAASAEAEAAAKDNAERVRTEQEAINDEVARDLANDLAAVAARFERLRRGPGPRTDSGGAAPADLSGPGAAPGGAAGAAPDQAVSAQGDLSAQPLCPARLICLTIDEAEEASRAAHNHDALIDWAIGQSAIRFAPEPRQ